MNMAASILGVIIWLILGIYFYWQTRPTKHVDMTRFACNETALKRWRDNYDPMPLEFKINSDNPYPGTPHESA